METSAQKPFSIQSIQVSKSVDQYDLVFNPVFFSLLTSSHHGVYCIPYVQTALQSSSDEQKNCKHYKSLQIIDEYASYFVLRQTFP